MKWTSLTVAFLLSAGALLAQEDASRSRLQENILKWYPGYAIDETEMEVACTGETLWEVEIEMGDENSEVEKTLIATADGQLRYEETGISPEQLPTDVMALFRQQCPKCGSVLEVERLTALDGTETLYELEGRKGLQNWTFLISESGKLICRK